MLVLPLPLTTYTAKLLCRVFTYPPGFSSHTASTSASGSYKGCSQDSSANSTKQPSSNTPNACSDGNAHEHSGIGNYREQKSSAHIATNASISQQTAKSHRKQSQYIKTIKRSNNLIEALSLPSLCNMNPRSLYNKIDEFHEFVQNEDIDALFMSESWERESKTLSEIINLEDYQVVSNVHQRKGQGGTPALVVNTRKYEVTNLTNTLFPIKWGVEAVWAILTPKNMSISRKVKRLACAAIYCKPGSKNKTDLLDHLSDAFNIVSTKFGKGFHFIIAGDTNELRLKLLLDLSPNFVQIVTKPTRVDKVTGKEGILDPVIMTLSKFYQTPEILAPIDSDKDKVGKPSDHKIVIVRPISAVQSQNARVTRKIEVQPITDFGLYKMKTWLISEDWNCVTEKVSANQKAKAFQELFVSKFNEYFPKKNLKISNDDQPWMSQKLKKLDRQGKEYIIKQKVTQI